MNDKELISILCPIFNEKDTIGHFYSEVEKVICAQTEFDWELIFINDGSTDGTSSVLQQITTFDQRVKVIELSRNFGKEIALSAGIDYSSGNAVIPIDVDLQDPVNLIPSMITKWNEGFQIVLARRSNRKNDTYLKRTTAKYFYKLINFLSDTPLPENVGDFRLMDRSVVDALKQMPENQRFMKGLFAWVGFSSCFIDYKRDNRFAGETKFNGRSLWKLALDGIINFSTLPLKVWTYCGSLGVLVCVSYAVIIFVDSLIFGNPVKGYPSTVILIIFFGSLQLIGIGILGEYIGRIFLETKRRPLYFVKNKVNFSDD
jgi:glycosyltransferase involved in cell wall biosynthesis